MSAPIYIVLTTDHHGNVRVATNAPMDIPHAGRHATSPALALAVTMLAHCTPDARCFGVAFGESSVPALELARELIHPEGYGHTVRQLQPEIAQHARRVLGLQPHEGAQS